MPISDGSSLESLANDAAKDQAAVDTDAVQDEQVVTEDQDTADPADGGATDDGGTDDGDGGGGEGTNQTAIMQWLSRESGVDLSKYRNDAEGLRGIAHLLRKVGERDEDAAWAKQIKPYKDQIEAWISAGQKQPGKQVDAGGDPEPEYNEAWETLVAQNAASPDIVQKYNQHVLWERRQLRKLSKNPEAILEDLLEKKLSERLKGIESQTAEITESLTQQQMNAAMAAWTQQHANDLYVNGDPKAGMTPTGKRASEIYNSDPFLQQLPELLTTHPTLAMTELAMRLARAEAPKPNKTKKIPKQALRTPAVATGDVDARSPDEVAADMILKDGASLAAAMAEWNRLNGT